MQYYRKYRRFLLPGGNMAVRKMLQANHGKSLLRKMVHRSRTNERTTKNKSKIEWNRFLGCWWKVAEKIKYWFQLASILRQVLSSFFHYSDYFLDIRIDSDYFEYVPLFTGLDGPAYQSIRLLTPYYCLNQSYDDVPKPLSDTQFTDYLVILSPLMTKAPYAVT